MVSHGTVKKSKMQKAGQTGNMKMIVKPEVRIAKSDVSCLKIMPEITTLSLKPIMRNVN